MKKSRGLFNSGWQDELYFRLILAKWTEIGSLWIRTVDKYPTECIVYWTILNRPSQTDLTFHQGQLASSTSSFHFKKHQTVPGALHVYNSMSDQSKHRTGSIGSEGCIKRGPGLLKFFFFVKMTKTLLGLFHKRCWQIWGHTWMHQKMKATLRFALEKMTHLGLLFWSALSFRKML